MIERMPKLSGARARGKRRVRRRSHGTRVARVFGIFIGGAFAVHANPCSAEPKAKNGCVAAYEQAQVSRQDGDLLEAQQELVSCAGANCPDAMQADCSRWLGEVQVALPSVVFRVLTPSGADITDARVELDNQPERPLDGRAIVLNPGQHQVTVRAPHFTPVTLQLQFVEGQKLRQEALTLRPIVSNAALPNSRVREPSPHPSPTQHRL